MNRNRHLHSVEPSAKPKKYSPPIFSDKNGLEKKLNSLGLAIKINKALKGGTVSQVYSAILKGQKVVVKHVDNLIPFDPTEFYIGMGGLKTDINVLNKLKSVRVPEIIKYIPEINITIMEDLREKEFVLLNDQIIKSKLNINSASFIGKAFAHLIIESRKWREFKTNESAEQSVYERGLELRLAYPNTQKEYLYLESEFVRNNKYFCWPDGHPKNIFVNNKGECAFIDFGRSHWSDQRYMLPNFLAHIVIYSLTGYIKKDLAKEYILRCIDTSKQIVPIDEEIFCQYLAMEVFHRANGKWVTGINIKEQKLSLLRFGMTVFDDKVNSVNNLIKLIR